MYSKLFNFLRQKTTLAALVANTALVGCVSAYAPVDGLSIKVPKTAQLSPELKEQLKFIDDVKAFEANQLGLKDGPHYREYNDGSTPVETLYLLLVNSPTKLPEYSQNYIYLETNQEYRTSLDGFAYFYSCADNLEDEKEYYQKQGYDVYLRSTTNFNSTGRESPVTNDFLKRTKVHQAQTIFHEDCHDWVNDNIGDLPSELDESFCQVVGYTGAVTYFKNKEGENSPNTQEALASFNWYFNYSQNINSYYLRLQKIYNDPKLTLEEKLKQREEVFEEAGMILGKSNNAALCDSYPYTKYFPLLLTFHERNGGKLWVTLEKMKACPENGREALEFIIKNSNSKN